ncbi:hypothetical protein P0E62_05835 [Enterococcus faecalis]|uniref:hypothetical protein n=1 Tax=Enterococcus faecalis TaxID=1351 RepID=UPI0025B00D4E|nr:hypothetical protein [Enterococcus faecalis]MDN3119143.1 hypothetical protein [Enterococcus faecalis]
MKQEELNLKLYELLLKIQNEADILTNADISESDAELYKYIISKGLVHNLKIEHYYSGPNIDASQAIITDKGYAFIEQISESNKPIKMNRENRYKQLQIFLKRLDDQDDDLRNPNKRVREIDYYDLIKYAIDSNLVKGIAIKYASNKPHLFLSQFARVTTEGYDVLDTPYPKKDASDTSISNIYNIYGGDQKGASFGSNNTTNNT